MDFNNNSEAELIAFLKNDNSLAGDAFNYIYFKYSSQVYGYCLYRSDNNDDANDLMQETWINFYNSIKSGKNTDSILPFLLTIARNLAINKYKHSQTRKNKNLIYFDSHTLENLVYAKGMNSLNYESEMEKDEVFKFIQVAIDYLDEKYKEVILLYWFGGAKFPEIARICGDTECAVRKRFERAMKKIDGILKPFFDSVTD